MSLTAQLLIAWVGLNLPLVALLWYGANVRQRRRAAAEAEAEAGAATRAPHHSSSAAPDIQPPAAPGAPSPAGSATGCDCGCEALRAEVRRLRLTVAELSIDRARLLAKLQPSPWQPRADRARPGR